jgi:hypothetical protein
MPFIEEREQPTIFQTVLILDALHDVPGTETIRDQAARYVASQASKQGAWNYWEQHSVQRESEPYPDDLDDTACALAALTRHEAGTVGSGELGRFAHLLVAAEQQPGGPYNTWLIDTDKAEQWKDIDLAVNANIGYALSLHGVALQNLATYIEQQLQKPVHSSYYVGEIPVFYFLSRWYTSDELVQRLSTLLKSPPQSQLMRAMLLSSACKTGLMHESMQTLAKELQGAMDGDHWPAEALYVDPAYNGVQYYGGSTALTTALVLEALTAYTKVTSPASAPQARHHLPTLMPSVRRDLASLSNESLRADYIAMAERIHGNEQGEQIVSAAGIVARAAAWKTPAAVQKKLNLGSLHGWIAYTLYDDVLDASAAPSRLNLANIALRKSYQCFLGATNVTAYQSYVAEVFDTMDCANQWEQDHARANVVNGTVSTAGLPDYGSHAQLARRSLGHSLAAVGVFAHHYKTLNHPAIVHLQTFFEHFLIARQLNDDAHDWEEDLQAGHISAVLAMLLQKTSEVDLASQLEQLRQRFWRETIDDVARLIRKHIAAAEQQLQLLEQYVTVEVFRAWLAALESAVAAALTGRTDTQAFIAAYEESYA